MALELRIGVLASGAGTNLQAILDQLHGRDGIEVVAVGSDKAGRRSARARGAGPGSRPSVFPRAEHADREARDLAIADWLEGRQVGLVVLAGYMQLLSPAFVARFAGRIDQRASGAAAVVSRASTRSGRRSTTASGSPG